MLLIRADDLAKNCTEVYNYDNGGNILSTKVYPLTWGSLSGVTATKTTNYTYGDSNWKDKLTAYGSTQLTYGFSFWIICFCGTFHLEKAYT